MRFARDPHYRFDKLYERGLLNWMPDTQYLKYKFKAVFGYELNLDNPQTFNEKLQWLKLHDRNPLYTTMVDKYAAKEYVGNIIGKEYIIPTLGVWNSFDEIDFDKLPNQFVLKTTHDSGGIVICRDKHIFDKKAARERLEKSLKNNFYYMGREWPYKNVPPRIIAESFMENPGYADLTDYKFFCFNGMPYYCQVISDRNTNECIDFFDMEWNLQEFTGLHNPNYPHYPHYPRKIGKPICLGQMKLACSVLAENIPFVRVDFYEVKGKMYFGEMTFYPASGLGEFSPKKWNQKMGDLVILP